MGLPAFTAREINKESLNLEWSRHDRKTQIIGSAIAKQCGQIHRLEATCTADTSDDSSADKAVIEYYGTNHLTNEIKQVQNQYPKAGQNL
jgi:hypothetical protein